jgi:hypothetical protein
MGGDGTMSPRNNSLNKLSDTIWAEYPTYVLPLGLASARDDSSCSTALAAIQQK